MCWLRLLKKKATHHPPICFFDTQKSILNVLKTTFRQNNVFCRFTNQKLWFSIGVVDFWVFVCYIKFFYNCKKIMQVLTGQYPTLYTYKFKFDFTDFKPSSTYHNTKNFLVLPKTVQVVHSQIFCTTPFNGAGITGAILRIFDANELPLAVNNTGQFIQSNVFGAHSTIMGSNQWVQPRGRVSAPTNQTIICNMGAPTTLTCRLVLPTSNVINNLTQGSAYVWVTVMKLP